MFCVLWKLMILKIVLTQTFLNQEIHKFRKHKFNIWFLRVYKIYKVSSMTVLLKLLL